MKLFIYIDIDKDEPQLLKPFYPIPEIYIKEVNAKTLAKHQLSVQEWAVKPAETRGQQPVVPPALTKLSKDDLFKQYELRIKRYTTDLSLCNQKYIAY